MALAPLLLSLPAGAGPVAIPSSPGASLEVAGPGALGGLAAGRTTIALGGSPQVTPGSSPILPRDMLQLLPLLGLIALALGIGFYAFAKSDTASIGRLATRRSPSRSSGLLPRRARWDATPHERLQDAKYLGLILEAELASSAEGERTGTAAVRSADASSAGGESQESPPDPASAA